MVFEASITSDMTSVIGMTSGLNDEDLNRALNDIGQVIINSVKIGFTRMIGPDGEKWSDNPPWYKSMKGGAAVLTGPTSKAIKGGRYAGKYEFSKINTQRMKNSLIKEVKGKESVSIRYKTGVRERGRLTHTGGDGTIRLSPIGGGSAIEINVKIQKRPHLDVAERYVRLGDKTDIQWIEEILSDTVDSSLGG